MSNLAISLIRTIIVYISLIISLRIMGKRQIGELAPSELVVAVVISDLASLPLQDIGMPLIYGLVPVLTLLCMEVLISFATMKNIKLRVFVGGKPSFIICEGKINQKEMSQNRLTLDELAVEMRKQNVMDISTIRHAILESDGTLSILLYSSQSPATPAQMNLNVDDPDYPVTVISDGHVLTENLKLLGFNDNWLDKKLKKYGVKSPKEVYILTSDKKEKIYFAKKEKTR